MAAEGPGGRELTQLMAHHVLLDVDGHVLPTIMDSDGVAHEGGEDGRAAAPGFQDLLLILRVQFLDPLQKLRGDIRAFLMDLLISLSLPYFSLRRFTMNLLVGFLPLRVL